MPRGYVLLPEAGTLTVRYEGPDPDVLLLAALEESVHQLAESVALQLLATEGVLPPWPRWWRASWYGAVWPSPVYDGSPPIRLYVDRITRGSIEQDVTVAVAAVLSDPFARSILASLLAELMIAVGKTAFARIVRTPRRESERPQIEVGPEVRKTLASLAAHADGQPVRLRLTYRNRDEEFEVELSINSEE